MDKRERRPIGSEDLSYIDWDVVENNFLTNGHHAIVNLYNQIYNDPAQVQNHCIKFEDHSWWFFITNKWIRQTYPGLNGLVVKILEIAKKNCTSEKVKKLCNIYKDMLNADLLLPMVEPAILEHCRM